MIENIDFYIKDICLKKFKNDSFEKKNQKMLVKKGFWFVYCEY